ncbi:hypothetical protein MY11210_004768 [Beauveria gryllotalpidicola]
MFALLVLGLSLVSAAPAGEQYPEVIPGPGLPSLEELGLTSAELYQLPVPKLPSADHTMSALYNPVCGPQDSRYTNVNGIIACYHYLNNLGTQDCKIDRETSHFCYAGDATVLGQARYWQGASSHCRDVAGAVLWTIDHCTRPDQSCAGIQAANGNGDLLVASGTKRFYG